MNEILGTIGVSLLVGSAVFLYYYRSRLGFFYPNTLSSIIAPIIAGLLVLSISSLVYGEHILSLSIGIIGSVSTLLPVLLVRIRQVFRVELDPYTWAVEVERRLAEPGPLDCNAIKKLFTHVRSPQYYEALAGILYGYYLRDPGEFLAIISSLTVCEPTHSLELHKRLTRLIVVEAESGIPYAYVRILLTSYKNLELPIEIIDYLTNTCIVACTSYGRVDSNCSELVVETLNQYVHLCSENTEVARRMLIDLLKNIHGQIIVKKIGNSRQIGISIAGRIIAYNNEWSKLLPCLERVEEKITI